MSRIKIKYFGPINEGCFENDGFIDIKKVTTFIGNQGSGKSAVAKLISIFSWIEKSLVRGDFNKKWIERKNRLKNQFLNYHRMENYIKNQDTYIEYQGDAYTIIYKDNALNIHEVQNSYPLPQIMYVPAERNFISYVKKPKELKLSSESLKEFLSEFDNAKELLKYPVKLPVNNTDIEYDKLNDIINLKTEKYKIKLTEASSGFQSLVPLFLVSNYLSNSVKEQSETSKEPMSNDEIKRFKDAVQGILQNDDLTNEQRRAALSVLSSKFNKTAFVNIVEEPEQNLFPLSQWQLLQSLLRFNNMNSGNKLIMTTHSPYIINFLSIAIQGSEVKTKIVENGNSQKLLSRLFKIVKNEALTNASDVVIYQLDDSKGSIRTLPSEYNIPSDRNFLNDLLGEGNRLFDELLEIEEDI
ncbi:MAG: ATP-binding protein [Bacteroidales bacterium]|jgi:predicted ATPase|nr:ATP-binding protein [Bacteroidales bacterium]